MQFLLIGKNVEIVGESIFIHPQKMKIGNHVHIEPRGYFEAKGGLEIGDHTILAPEVVILTSMHRYKDAAMVPYDEVDLLRPVKIGRCVWIGMRVMIMPGVEIGEGSILAAGAVVTKSCPAGSILGGNPAQVIGQRDMAQYEKLVKEEKFYLLLKQTHHLQKKDVVDEARKKS